MNCCSAVSRSRSPRRGTPTPPPQHAPLISFPRARERRRTTPSLAAALIALAFAGSGCAGRTTSPDAAARRLFVKAGCGDCHALADAGTRGGVGPDFDTSERLDRTQLLRSMLEGANGMPSYAHRLSAGQRGALADYLLRFGWAHRTGRDPLAEMGMDVDRHRERERRPLGGADQHLAERVRREPVD